MTLSSGLFLTLPSKRPSSILNYRGTHSSHSGSHPFLAISLVRSARTRVPPDTLVPDNGSCGFHLVVLITSEVPSRKREELDMEGSIGGLELGLFGNRREINLNSGARDITELLVMSYSGS
jgi:hypothetical protein